MSLRFESDFVFLSYCRIVVSDLLSFICCFLDARSIFVFCFVAAEGYSSMCSACVLS